MAGLPHWNNSAAAVNYWEPLFLNQFEVVITPPAVITQNVNLLVEHVMTVTGLPELTPTGVIEQTYKFARRSYAAAVPTTTVADLDIKFSVNLNNNNEMYIYNILRAWADLAYDPLTGKQGLKKDYIGEIYVAIHNKAQDIYREFRFKPVIPNGELTKMALNYTSPDIYEVTMKFRADAWKEARVGQITV